MIIYPVKNMPGFTIGGKAKGLLKLHEADIHVPDFLVIPAENFDHIIHEKETDTEVIKDKLMRFIPVAQDEEKIRHILSGWNFPHQSIIVRSSIADEDGTNDAFAGIMSSYMNLRTYEDVIEAIGKCAASAYSAAAVAYRQYKQLSAAARPAVILQQQITAEASGVVFSTYPQYPLEMAVHAVWGLGEGLVNGELEPDEFYLSKKDGSVVYQKIAMKDRCYQLHEEKGIQLMDVEQDRQQMHSLTEKHLEEIFSISARIEKISGSPQDIEYVISEDRLYFVQSRPVTQEIPEMIVYDNSNIQESYCGVTTPLTFSFAQNAYATVYFQTIVLLAVPEKVIAVYTPVVNNLLGLVKGRIYYNINNWYRCLQLLPSFKQNKEDMERMMGLEEPVDFIIDTEKTFTEKLRLILPAFFNLFRLFSAFRKLKKSVAHFHSHFTGHYERFYKLKDSLTDPEQILKQKKLLDKELLQNWTTPIINDLYVMMMNGKVRRKLIKSGIIETDEFLSRYLAGNQEIESAQPALVMQKLSLKAMEQDTLKELIILLPDEIHRQVKAQFPLFYQEVESFIHIYGDRTVGELKLETITMRLSPKIFYSYLRNYLKHPGSLQTSALSHLHESAVTELKEKLQNHSGIFRKMVYGSLVKLQKSIQYREALRLERTRMFGMYRTLYLAAGKILTKRCILKQNRDIFYLTESEIEMLLLGKPEFEIAGLIEQRTAIFEQYKKENVPARVIIPPVRGTEGSIPEEDDISVLRGTGCVSGQVTAEVIVIEGPESDLDVSGKIICALRTDPGWVALFPTCKGVLIEKGSALSHSVILLREFGIPAIINIPGLTRKISSGQQISMDGTNGEIRLL